MSENVSKTDDGIYSTSLEYAEIMLLYAGVLPYVAFDHDPMVPDGEFLWIHQSESENDKNPLLDPIPCRVLSCVQFLPDLFILTLQPDEIDLDLSMQVEKLKAGIARNPSTYRTEALLHSSVLN